MSLEQNRAAILATLGKVANEAAIWADIVQVAKLRTETGSASARRKRYATLARSLASLRTQIEALQDDAYERDPFAVTVEDGTEWPDDPGALRDLSGMLRHLSGMETRVARAQRIANGEVSRGHPMNWTARAAVNHLANVYRDATGKEPSFSNSTPTRFHRFAQVVASAAGLGDIAAYVRERCKK